MGGVPVFSVPQLEDVIRENEEEEKNVKPVIDIMRDFQYGKNGSVEYKWSPYAPERYVQLYFQATSSPPSLENKMKIMTEFWDLLRNAVRSNNNSDKMHLFRLLLQCRDRKEGKGSWSLSLHLLCVVLREDYMGFLDLFKRIVGSHEDSGERERDRLGCWRDFRELQYLLQKSDLVSSILPEDIRHAAVNDITEICVERLIKDEKILHQSHLDSSTIPCAYSLEEGSRGRGRGRARTRDTPDNTLSKLSMLGKWFPREKSKYGWLYNQIYRKISKDAIWREALKVNSKSDLRALLSKLNQHLDTLEVKQCKRDWHKIDFSHVSTSRLLKHLDSFMGKRNSDDIDRRLCKKRLLQHIRDHYNKKLSYVCEDMGKLVHQAKMCIDLTVPSVEKEEMIDSLWNDHLDLMKREWDESMGDREALIYPMIDLSASMLADSLGDKDGSYSSSSPRAYSAIAIGLTLAHVSRQSSVILYGTNASLINTSEEVEKENVVTMDQRHRKYGKDRKYYSLCRMVKRIMADSAVGSGSISRIDKAMSVFKQVHSSDHKYGYSVGDREYLVLLSDFQYSPNYKICNIRDIENRCVSTSQVNETLNSTIPVSTVIGTYISNNLNGPGSVTPHTVFWNMSSTSGFPGLSFFEKSVFLSGSNPRSFLHAIRPKKEKETERRDDNGNAPKKKKIHGYSSASMQNVDGNNMMWNKTPCFYVYKSLLRRRYESSY